MPEYSEWQMEQKVMELDDKIKQDVGVCLRNPGVKRGREYQRIRRLAGYIQALDARHFVPLVCAMYSGDRGALFEACNNLLMKGMEQMVYDRDERRY